LSPSTPGDPADIPDLTLVDFVSGLSSTASTPGAGAAGALALALGAACAAKAFAISARHTADKALEASAERARTIAALALEGAQRDAADFRAWLKVHDCEAGARLQADAGILFVLADELEALIAEGRLRTIPSLCADLDAALTLLRAGADIEKRNLADL
jgi:hypothetical protein